MIPIYEAEIVNDLDGIFKISLVDRPAVESNFICFNKNEKQVEQIYAIQDEEQHIVFGVLMRADYNIYRYDKEMGEYFIRYSKDTIKKMAEKMLHDQTQNNINLMHKDGTDVEGINLLEIFIKNSEKGINPSGFEEIEEGSLFCSYKVNNDQIWQLIKSGTFLGFSLEGMFSIDLDQKYSKQKNKYMTKYMTKLSDKIMRNIVKFGSVKTDNGELFWVGEGELELGDELFQDTEEGRVKVEDGTYVTEDGTEITVTEGLVTEIKKQEDPTEEVEVEAEDEPEIEQTDKVAELEAKVAELEAKIAALEAKVAEIVKEPAAEPIAEQFDKVTKQTNIIPKFGSRSRLIG